MVGCPPLSVALIWRAFAPGTAGEAVAQEGLAQLEVALPSSLTHGGLRVGADRGQAVRGGSHGHADRRANKAKAARKPPTPKPAEVAANEAAYAMPVAPVGPA